MTMADIKPDDPRFNTREAAKYSGFEPATLSKWRIRGKGPAFLKMGGKVFYRKADLDAFINGSRVDPAAALVAAERKRNARRRKAKG